MSARVRPTRVGELRPSQVLHSFGIGSIVELPHLSAPVLGLDDWDAARTAEVREDRLLEAVREQLGGQVLRLAGLPVPSEGDGPTGPLDPAALVGIPVAPFPRWLRCPYCGFLGPLSCGLFEFKPDPWHPDQDRYVHRNCQKASGGPPTVLPTRFLVACENGHLDDFPWVEFVHGGPTTCHASLALYEVGVSGEAADVFVKCATCGKSRAMSQAFGQEARDQMPLCRGRHPHLRSRDEDCGLNMKAILLGASNTWFGVSLSALHLPVSAAPLDQLVDAHWGPLQLAQSAQNVGLIRALQPTSSLARFTDEQVWEAIQRKRSGTAERPLAASDLRAPEWRAFTHPDASRTDPDFRLAEVPVPEGYEGTIAQVVLAERLREVTAAVGFTRILSPGDADDEDGKAVHRVGLSRGAPTWTPAVEVRGEGIFLAFHEARLADWCQGAAARREEQFREAHRRSRQARNLPDPDVGFPGIRYVLLHTLSHALMRQLALECGYTAASIRERIYARAPDEDGGPMAGLLLYTAAPDSEGTLGGLVRLGEPRELGRHLDLALESMLLCASDPLCAEHHPWKDGLSVHGAACHACLFAPETSCERGNRFLDRSVLVDTVNRPPWALFGGRS